MHPNIIDLTQPLNTSTPIYPGDPLYTCKPHATHARDGYSVHALALGTHTGTHIDAPSHFLPDGAPLESVPLSTFVGHALVVDLTEKKQREHITAEDLASALASIETSDPPILLLRTNWSIHRGDTSYFAHPFLNRAAAEAIARSGVRLVGIDALSPDETNSEGQADFAAHEVLLGAGVLIAENLSNLSSIQNSPADGGRWMVSLMPLRIDGGVDGSPVRAYAFSSPLPPPRL
jgi:kynurenine formamidase